MVLIKTWKEEGYCEYIAEESSFGFEKGLNLFMQEKKVTGNSYDYFKYRLYVQYLIDFKKMSIDEIFEKKFNINKLEAEIRANIADSLYIIAK